MPAVTLLRGFWIPDLTYIMFMPLVLWGLQNNGVIPSYFKTFTSVDSDFPNPTLRLSIYLPLNLEIVQLRRTLPGKDGSSKTKGPTLGSASASDAVMLILELGCARSHTWASRGTSTGALSLISMRKIWRVPVPLA